MNHLFVFHPEIQSILKKWQEQLLLQRRLSSHTAIAYLNDVTHFLNFLTQHTPQTITLSVFDQLTLRDCRAWLASRHHLFHSRSNARAVASVKNLWRYLLQQKKITSEVFLHLTSPKIQKTLPRPLSKTQASLVVNEIQDLAAEEWIGLRNRALFMLLYATGLRISEALSLSQKDSGEETLHILGKGKKERYVPLLTEVRIVLRDYLMKCPYQGEGLPLFIGLRGKRLQPAEAAKVLRRFRRMYDLPETLTPHALRHTCASHLMNASNDLRSIQTLLGHSSLSSTQIYTDLDTEKLLETYRKAHPRRS